MNMMEVRRQDGRRALVDPRAIEAILEDEERVKGNGLRRPLIKLVIRTLTITIVGETIDEFWKRYTNSLGINAWIMPGPAAFEPEPEPEPKTVQQTNTRDMIKGPVAPVKKAG